MPPTVIEQLHDGQDCLARRWAAKQDTADIFSADAPGSFVEAAQGSATFKGHEDQLLCKRAKTMPTKDYDEKSTSCSSESMISTEVLTSAESSSAVGSSSGTACLSSMWC